MKNVEAVEIAQHSLCRSKEGQENLPPQSTAKLGLNPDFKT
jgi:hypothetical protein